MHRRGREGEGSEAVGALLLALAAELAWLCCVLCCLVLTWAFSAAFLVLDLTPFTSPRALIAEALVAAQRTDRREWTIAVRAEESAAHRTRFSETSLQGSAVLLCSPPFLVLLGHRGMSRTKAAPARIA